MPHSSSIRVQISQIDIICQNVCLQNSETVHLFIQQSCSMPLQRSERLQVSQASNTMAQGCKIKITHLLTKFIGLLIELSYHIYGYLVPSVVYHYCIRSFDQEDNPVREGSMVRVSPRDPTFLAITRTCRLICNDWPRFLKLISLALQVYPECWKC